jgi:DNA-binding MltR family transcriptional regulator
MQLQLIKDGYGNNAGVFVPMNDWDAITQKHQDLKILIDIEQDNTDDDNSYQFTDAQKADLDKHIALRKTGVANYTPWEEVRANAMKKLNDRRSNG